MASWTRAHRRLIAVIGYGSVYLVLYIILLGLLIVTPADAIERSLRNRQIYNIWILTAGYLFSILVVSFVFFTRLYITKTDLAAIPKGWVPIEKGDVRSRVYKMISAGLSRSAFIAYEARPRLRPATDDEEEEEYEPVPLRQKTNVDSRTAPEDLGPLLSSRKPVWGDIEHYGWGSPNSPDLPNLHYVSVISELPNLIEGKALTLAPADETSRTEIPVLDPDAVALLQRTSNMGLRDYVVHLADLGVLELDTTVMQFLAQYEYARFSTRPISNARFKELMHLFAEILRQMEPYEPDPVQEERDSDMTSTESQADYEARLAPTQSNADSASISSSTRRRVRKRNSSASWYQWRTAPNSLRSRVTGAVSRKSSNNSLAPSQSQRLRPVPSQPSSSSLRSKMSASSGSVIRLATRHDTSDLPYILSLRDTAGSI